MNSLETPYSPLPLCNAVVPIGAAAHDRGYLAKQAFRLPYPVNKGRELRNSFVPSNYHAEGESMCRNFVMVERYSMPPPDFYNLKAYDALLMEHATAIAAAD
jgi:hypothetical protein